jgi:hypothetical protein
MTVLTVGSETWPKLAPWLRPRSIDFYACSAVAVEPPVPSRRTIESSFYALATRINLQCPLTMSAGAYKFAVTVWSPSTEAADSYMSFALTSENERAVVGADVVLFKAYLEMNRVEVAARRSWIPDRSTVIDIAHGEEHELLSAILTVCAKDLNWIRLNPKQPLHLAQGIARDIQMIRDRA